MRFLVFQHIAIEHPGIFREFLRADGATWDAVELDEGEPIPVLDGYDALWVMGGPMDVWQEDAHPWLVPEKRAIRDWVATGKPFLGVCLGHQLLADAMGGRVVPGAAPEVGVTPVELTEEGRKDPLFRGFPAVGDCFQWHGAAVRENAAETIVLARTEICPVQAIRVGARAYGLQYHVEVTEATVPEWGCVPEYEAALEQTMGEGALDRLAAETRDHLPNLNATARKLYENFMGIAHAA